MNKRQELSPISKPRFFYGWYMVAASWVLVFLISAVAVSVFFKPMLEDFGWDRATLSSVQTVALIVFTVASPFLGRFIDRVGPRIMIFICIVPQVLSNVINGVATNIWHLYLARFFYGINVLPSTQILINKWFVKKRGTALGIVATGMPLGTMILVPFSQYLILTWGWRPTMLFWAAVVFVIMLPLALNIKDNPEEKGYGPDRESLNKAMPFDPPKRDNTALAAKAEEKTGSSLSEAVKTRSFWFMAMAHFICGTGCGFMMTHIVIFATDMGYSEMIGASLVSVQGGLNLVGVLATGYLSDRIARSKVLSLTHFVRSISFATIVIFILLGGDSLWILYAAMAFFGFGWFTTAPLQAGLVADLFGSLRMGTILGVVVSCHMLGMAIGAFAGGAIFESTNSYYLVFLTQGLLEFLAVIFALSIRHKKHYIAIESP